MQTMTPRNQQSPLRVQWIIWAVLFATYFIYGFVAMSAANEEARENWRQLFLLKPLLFMSVIMLLLSHLLPKRAFLSSLNSMRDPDREAILMRTTVPNIISWALNESVAVYGLILAFRTADVMPYYIFASIAALNMLILRPSPEKWLNLANEQMKLQTRSHE